MKIVRNKLLHSVKDNPEKIWEMNFVLLIDFLIIYQNYKITWHISIIQI